MHLEKVYLNLARDELLWGMDLKSFLHEVCKTVCQELKADRISVHVFEEDNNVLNGLLYYSNTENDIPIQNILKKNDYPDYFNTLQQSRILFASDAINDERTREFSDTYFSKFGITSVLDASLHHAGVLQGVVCIDYIAQKKFCHESEKIFLISISDLISQRLLIEKLEKEKKLHSQLKSVEQALVVTADYSIITTDHAGEIIQVNQATTELLKCDSNDLLGNNISEYLLIPRSHNDLIFTSNTNIENCLSPNFPELVTYIDNNDDADYECILRLNSDEILPVSLTISRLVNVDEELKGFICTLADISKRINVRKALINQENKYRHLFEGSGDAIFLVKNYKIVDCNEEAVKTFSSSRENFIDRTFYDLSPEFQPNGELSRTYGDKYIKSTRNGKKIIFEWQFLGHDKTPLYAEVAMTMIENEDEQIFMASVRDISSRKESEIELATARKTVEQHNIELALINNLSNKLHATNSQEEIYNITLKALIEYPIKPGVAIYTVDSEKNELHYKCHHSAKPGEMIPLKVIPINPNFIGIALENIELLYSPDITCDDRILPNYKAIFALAGLRSVAIIPLVYLNKQVAVILLGYTKKDPLNQKNLDALYSIGKTVSLALINAEKNAELSYVAHHDNLTGLSNRNYFHNHFFEFIKSGETGKAALFLLDLDRFKEINDSMGHFTGDQLLKKIGLRLSSLNHNRQYMVSRLGGDEFIVLVNGIDGSEQASHFIEELSSLLSTPFQINDMQLMVDASIGVALYPYDGVDSHALLRSADVAMYIAKSSVSNFSYYDSSSDIHTPERLAMIAELGASLKSGAGHLFLHYQPKMNLNTQEIVGFEALARWEHPSLGNLSPAMFVPLVEVSNSIYQFTEEVLHQALAQQMQWRKSGHDFSVAVNISARNLMDDRLVNLIQKLLVEYDVEPAKLELEVTESAVMQDAYKAIDYLHQIARLGVQLSIDDFGTGYSSLAYLRNLPINKLKLDRSFVMGMMKDAEGESIVQTIISLAKTMKLEVIAEGVEDVETLSKLYNMKCDTAQGYYICKPNNWDFVNHWLKRRKKDLIKTSMQGLSQPDDNAVNFK